jgi:TonB family protein
MDEKSLADGMPPNIGRYKVLEGIGFGAMGAVYRAFDPLIKRTLAIKTIRLDIPRQSPQYKSFIDRFYHEARISGTLSHPNIVTLFDIGEEAGIPYLAMEFVEGETLAAVIERGTRFKPEKVIGLVSQIAAALDYAHGKGVIHRDVKPANLMLYEGDRVKVTDFGIAKLVDAEMTQSGTLLGTPSYMSPEQAMGDKLDGRSDIFSLGVCAFEMLSGEQPFPGNNVTSILYKLVHVDPIEPANLELNGLVPQKWHEVFSKVLAKKPEERYQDAGAFVHDLEYCLGSWFGSLDAEQTVLNASPGDMESTSSIPPPAASPARGAAGRPAAPPPPEPEDDSPSTVILMSPVKKPSAGKAPAPAPPSDEPSTLILNAPPDEGAPPTVLLKSPPVPTPPPPADDSPPTVMLKAPARAPSAKASARKAPPAPPPPDDGDDSSTVVLSSLPEPEPADATVVLRSPVETYTRPMARIERRDDPNTPPSRPIPPALRAGISPQDATITPSSTVRVAPALVDEALSELAPLPTPERRPGLSPVVILGGAAALFLLAVVVVVGVYLWNRGRTAPPSPEPTVTLAVEPTPLPEPSASALTPVTPTGVIRVDTQPPGAAVTVNGETKGASPLELTGLSFGDYSIKLELKGYEPRSAKVQVTEQTPEAEVKVTLARPPPAQGIAEILSTPFGAAVTVDGVKLGATPLTDVKLKPGTRKVEMTKDGFEPWSGTVDIEAGKRGRVDAQLKMVKAAPTPPPTPEAPEPNRVYKDNEVDTKPKKLSGSGVSYPESLPKLKSGESVSVAFEFVVSEEGQVTEVKILQSGGKALDDAALNAIKTWKYAPGVKRGAKVAVRMTGKQTFLQP